VILALLINLISVLLDIIVVSVNWPGTGRSKDEFSAVMAVINLLLRYN